MIERILGNKRIKNDALSDIGCDIDCDMDFFMVWQMRIMPATAKESAVRSERQDL